MAASKFIRWVGLDVGSCVVGFDSGLTPTITLLELNVPFSRLSFFLNDFCTFFPVKSHCHLI